MTAIARLTRRHRDDETDLYDQQHAHSDAADAPSDGEERQQSALARGGAPGLVRFLVAGLAGAATVTLLNEAGRRLLDHPPRLEVIGQRGVAKAFRAVDRKPPRGRRLYRWSLAADLTTNTLYYGLAGLFPRGGALPAGGLLGLGAGLGAALLPRRVGLGKPPRHRRPTTPLLTVAWYAIAGLIAGSVGRALGGRVPDES